MSLDGEAVLLDLASGTYFGLDAVGTRIWELLDQRQPLAAILDAILDEYDVEEHARERTCSSSSRRWWRRDSSAPTR